MSELSFATPLVQFQELGLIGYQEAWDYQETLFQSVVRQKEQPGSLVMNQLLFCQHPHVFTLGRNGSKENLLMDSAGLQARSAEFIHTNRGGDITYHGPGQLVGYPIFSLQDFRIGLKEYVYRLEEAIILTVSQYGLLSSRLPGATGVWFDPQLPGKARKICAIGIRCSHWVTMHGFAFNIHPDLRYFECINPCGFVDKQVTSLEKELGESIDFFEVSGRVFQNLQHLFGFEIG